MPDFEKYSDVELDRFIRSHGDHRPDWEPVADAEITIPVSITCIVGETIHQPASGVTAFVMWQEDARIGVRNLSGPFQEDSVLVGEVSGDLGEPLSCVYYKNFSA